MRYLAILTIAVALWSCNRAPGDGTSQNPPASYSLSATVSGLNGGGLVLQNNGTGDVKVTANGSVTFTSTQLSGTTYKVTVLTQPASPDQTCTVANGSGMVGGTNVTDVTVTCTDNYVPTYTPAAKGDPQGTATTQMIDAAGGSITSADGRITLDIPAGALAAATTISVQPITNTTPNGMGLAYRLEPEGTTFAAPATLTFHLSASEALALASTYVTTQHADGLWYSQPNQQRDGSAQTVGVSTTHFSDWSLAETVRLDPPEQRVKTSEAVTFTASILIVNEEGDELANPFGDDVAVPTQTPLSNQLNGDKIWSVNGIEGGNAAFGQVRDPGSYTAPSKEPTPNPATVTLTIQLGTAKVIAPALADVYASEVWTGTTDITQLDGTQIHADVTFVQKPDPSGTVTVLHFVVQSGEVHVKLAPTSGSGCAQSITPDSHTIGAADPTTFEGGDGSMMVTYDQVSGPEDGEVTGGGTTAWFATLTVACPNGTQMVDTTAAAQWWPFSFGQTVVATNGVLDATVSNDSASGTIHFVRQ
jgi:hypothetical protein